MPIATVYAVLSNDSATMALVAGNISPVETPLDVAFPNITLTVLHVEPQNTVNGYANLDRVEVQMEAWAKTYDQAFQVAKTARAALEAAGHFCISRMQDEFILEPGTHPGLYRVGFVHQVWMSYGS